MANVFLSYDHDDADRAAPVATVLENAGHSVWWDRNIHGGAEYNSEIEGAVERADAVVVLWSEGSVRSAWVRDEAAEGRDNGKLIPVLLEPVKPPMGFRQFQTIDLSKWKKRTDPSFGELLRAIDKLAKCEAVNPAVAELKRHRAPRISPIVAGIAVALLVAITGLFLWRPWQVGSGPPSVTVIASDEHNESRAIASDLLIKLGSLEASRADSLELVESGSGAEAEFALKVGAAANAGAPRANLALVNREGTLLWSREFTQPGGNEADLRQQLAYSAGQVLRCATEALAPDHPKLERTTLKLYLGGCAELSTTLADPRASIQLFRKVTEQSPRFPGGWGKLIVAELEAFKATNATDFSLKNVLRADVEKARTVDPDLAEIYLALSWLQSPRPILGWMRFADQAAAKNPDHAETLQNRALGLLHVGRMREAVFDARRAAELEPLSSKARENLIIALTDAGDIEAARKELSEAERLWPGATNLLHSKFWLEANYGDARQAMRLFQSGKLGLSSSPSLESFLKARVEPSRTNVDRAIADAKTAYGQRRDIYPLVTALAAFDRTDELAHFLLSVDPRVEFGVGVYLSRPRFAKFRRDQRFMKIAERHGLNDYWRDSGKWPDFCFEPDLPYDCKREAAKLAT